MALAVKKKHWIHTEFLFDSRRHRLRRDPRQRPARGPILQRHERLRLPRRHLRGLVDAHGTPAVHSTATASTGGVHTDDALDGPRFVLVEHSGSAEDGRPLDERGARPPHRAAADRVGPVQVPAHGHRRAVGQLQEPVGRRAQAALVRRPGAHRSGRALLRRADHRTGRLHGRTARPHAQRLANLRYPIGSWPLTDSALVAFWFAVATGQT